MHNYLRSFMFAGLCFLSASFALGQPIEVSRADSILARVHEADERCRDASIVVPTTVDAAAPEGMKIAYRPVLLCAYGETSQTWHTIEVALPYPIPRSYITCVAAAPTLADRPSCALDVRVVTPGYRIEHLAGFGATRFIVNATTDEGEKLTVYRTRHLWFDDDALASGKVSRIIETVRAVNYTPYHPDFMEPELVDAGMRFLRGAIGDVYRDLRASSNAFPDRTLAEVVPWQIIMSLAAIEQMDDKTYQEDKERTTKAIFVEYALNREGTFKWSQSGAAAIGALQFTNRGGDGTYSAVVRKCPDAQIDPSFEVGARNLHNVIKAATCLIDLEVAQFPTIKPLFARSPLVAGIYPVAAYNGSPASARALYAWISRRGIDVEKHEIDVPNAFIMSRVEKCPCKNVKVKKGKKRIVSRLVVYAHNTETPMYVEKYIYLLNFLADKELE